jgi:hypothetical protein
MASWVRTLALLSPLNRSSSLVRLKFYSFHVVVDTFFFFLLNVASSKRVYGTQLSYLALGQTISLTWKLHHPATTGTLTGDLSMDIVRHTMPPPSAAAAATTTPIATSSTSTVNINVNVNKLTIGVKPLSAASVQIHPPSMLATTVSNLFSASSSSSSSLSSSISMSSDYVPPQGDPFADTSIVSITNQHDTNNPKPEMKKKKTARFQLPVAGGGSGTALLDNRWAVRMPPPVEMSLAQSKTICQAEVVPLSDSSSSSSSPPPPSSSGEVTASAVVRNVELPVGLTNTRFLRIACSMFGAIAVAEDGSLHYWTKDSDNNKFTEGGPVPSLAGSTIVDIAAGHDHYLVVTVDGDLFAWGSNQYNQCSRDPISRIQTPTKVTTKHVLACSAGAHSSLAIDGNGIVYTWGRAQTSVTIPADPFAEPHDHSGERPRTAPSHQTIAVDALGHGSAQVSIRSNPLRVSEPTMICLPEPALMLQGSLSSTMCVLVSRDGSVFAWGDANATCGASAESFSSTPIKIPFPKDVRIVRALAGDYHALALDSEGKLWTWGARFAAGKLVPSASLTSDPHRLKELGSDAVIDFGISRTTSTALTSSGDVWTWGLFKHPLKAVRPHNIEASVGVGHGTSSDATYLVQNVTTSRHTDSIIDLQKIASQIYFDDPTDYDMESDIPTEDE